LKSHLFLQKSGIARPVTLSPLKGFRQDFPLSGCPFAAKF